MTHTLILLRHGQSVWNLENLFTGWIDVGLTAEGEEEARQAARLMLEAGLKPDVVYTSVLRRATDTADITLEEAGWEGLPIKRSWRLNERHYGALQGLDKVKTAERYGDDQVLEWRRSYSVRPPALEPDDERHPSQDELYDDVPRDEVPSSEALADVVDRLLPYWHSDIAPDLREGLTPLIVAHGNSIRALLKHLEDIPEDEIVGLNIPTGIPLIIELDDDLEPVSKHYLGDQEAAEAAAEAVARQAGG